MRKEAWVCISVVMVVMVLIFSASQAKAEPIKIGANIPRTGALGAVLGKSSYRAITLAVKLTNEAGGVNGQPLELVLYDDESNIDLMVSNLKKLIEKDRVIGVVGPVGTPQAAASTGIFAAAKVPHVVIAGGYTPKPQDKYTFIGVPSGELAIEAPLRYFKSKGKTRLGVLNPNTAIADEGDRGIKRYGPGYGITVVADERYTATDVDMTPGLTKVWAEKPDLIWNYTTGKDGAIVRKNMAQLGINVPYYCSGGNATRAFIKLLGETTSEVYSNASKMVDPESLPDSDPDKAKILKFYEVWEKEYGIAPIPFDGYAYDSAAVLIDAIKRAGTSPTRETVKESLEKTRTFPGVVCKVSYDGERHYNYTAEYVVITIREGTWKLAK
jgi:branched-chain amino acid transport system substrate-binding protein